MLKEEIPLYLKALPMLKRYAKKNVHIEDQDDFIQNAIIRILKEKKINSFNYYKIDNIRYITNFKKGQGKQLKQNTLLEAKANVGFLNYKREAIGEFSLNVAGTQELETNNKLRVERFLKRADNIHPIGRAITILRNYHSFTGKEISVIFGLSQSRCSQIEKKYISEYRIYKRGIDAL